MTYALEVTELTASLGDLEILKGVDLVVPFGEVHAIMGPNGSGKSTLSHALSGKGEYTVSGSARVAGVEILGLSVYERARRGLFHGFQYPTVIPGVSLDDLTGAMRDASDDAAAFDERVEAAATHLRMGPFRSRGVNEELSGGEKKRSEMFQLAVADPQVAILDEIDSGLDIDAVREVAELVESLRDDEIGLVIITHYSRILRYMQPDRIHVMLGGKIVRSGGGELAEDLEAAGYESIRAELSEAGSG